MEEIRGERVLIRRFRPDDGPALHAMLGRPEAVRFEPYGVQGPARCDELAAERSVDPAFWALCLTAGDLVGTLYLAREEPEDWRTYELGYVLNPDHWGRGLATEGARHLLDRCFGSWEAHRVVARCDPHNGPSWRLLERLGMRREGLTLASASFALDDAGAQVWHDAYLYAVLEREWAVLRRSS